jgi:2,4-dienoyl-CoA reductase-like NADH-dependent reductase (Old Yellow Enzyme family)
MSARRIFFVGVNTGYARDGEPTEAFVSFFEARSSPKLHCTIVGNVVVPGGESTNPGTARIGSRSIWRDLAARITRKGSVPGIQLASNLPGFVASASFKAQDTAAEIARARALVNRLTPAEVTSILRSLEEGSRMAVDAGFRHIQLHAAHGYLFNVLLDDRINRQASEVRLEIADWLRRWNAAGVETSVRTSLRSGDVDFDSLDADRFHDTMALLPSTYLDVSSGYYAVDKRLIYPARKEMLAERHEQTRVLARAHLSRAFIASGRVLASAVDWPSNVHFGVCRDLIANPGFLDDLDNGCENRGKCHYFSRGSASLTCAKWRHG